MEKWYMVKEEDQELFLALTQTDKVDNENLNQVLFEHLDVARGVVQVKGLVNGEYQERELEFGQGQFRDAFGPGTGEGKVSIEVAYASMQTLYQGWTRKFPPTESTPRHHGILLLKVISATQLYFSGEDLIDCYCQISVAHRKVRTTTREDEKEPKWNEEFEFFDVSSDENLVIEVYDEGNVFQGRFTQNQSLIGSVSVPLMNVAAMPRMEKFQESYTLTRKDYLSLVKRGKILLEMQWIPLDELSIGRSVITSHRGSLGVYLKGANDLVSKDWWGKEPDGQCILTFNDMSCSSDMIEDDPEPQWHQEFWWDRAYPRDVLDIKVYDKGVVDVLMGEIVVDVYKFVENPGQIYHEHLKVGDHKNSDATLEAFIVWLNRDNNQPTNGRINWPVERQTAAVKKPRVVHADDWPYMKEIMEEIQAGQEAAK